MAGSSLAINARSIFNERDKAAHLVGRDPHSIRVLAVSKGFPVDVITLARSLGMNAFGENYVQEWQDKNSTLNDPNIEWHFIGGLQSNKVKLVVGKVELIHSLDRDSLAEEISKRAQDLGITQKVLVEINMAGEQSKSGLSPALAGDKIRQWSGLAGLNLSGLMIMPPMAAAPEASRLHFRQAKTWFEDWRPQLGGHNWNELSMGTSQDFSVAIEEGATLIRVGTALFGPRAKNVKES